MICEADDISQRLARRASETPDLEALVYLRDGDAPTDRMTFAMLDRRSDEVAEGLREILSPGAPVMIAADAPTTFAPAYFGAMRAGAIPVPCASSTRGVGRDRLAAILRDCGAGTILTDTPDTERLRAVLPPATKLLAIEEMVSSHPSPTGKPSSTALLQYTSGSTGSPKGVVIPQAALRANLIMLEEALSVTGQTTFVSWLPLFHDMGLIANMLLAVWTGTRAVFLPPAKVFQRPLRWLKAIERYNQVISGGPNFIYAQCSRQIGPEAAAALDLSRWNIATCGSERIDPATHRTFAQLFLSAGFDPAALMCGYGLAEATVFVSGRRGGLRTRMIDGQEEVACGSAPPETLLTIVDPLTGAPMPEGAEGEIWVGGSHVAAGYWGLAEEEVGVFTVAANGEGSVLRTGDFGRLIDDQLYVTGRMKDLLIVRGANHHPEDLEQTVLAACSPNAIAAAAFAVPVRGSEEAVVMIESAVRRPSKPSKLLRAASQAVAARHGLRLFDAVLVTPGGLARTSSGKLARSACLKRYLAADAAVLAALRISDPALIVD